ncbi:MULTISPECIES: PepSY domain-containing protein [Brevibacterium]|uniref:Peptidase propeptide domain-containing protein n=3 Tax=Brevibacterium casei TaxID=33889 RepID=K9APK8_9MICO|nr:PepSY domain-containing protein [Brevibacterium casei]NJE65978.1 peptidase [Brevibacterium sp. LS14]EKU49343.1 Peptidase propeptide domain-containing protein [Brevibacterium casei S18]KZE09980.1 peptidase [Brevibacterium casei]MBE4694622.1 peptidase [Brevibacterium casei]MBY3577744.1 peptidase [Brevibacterium casei]
MNTVSPVPFTAAVALTLSLTLAGCSNSGDETEQAPTSGDPVPTQSEDSGSAGSSPDDTTAQSAPTGASDLPEDADLSSASPQVTPDEAIAVAQKEAGNGTVHAIELDYDRRDGAWQYEVKILKDRTDFDIDVDAQSGKIAKTEQDTTDDSEQAIDLTDPLPFDEALNRASEQGKGRLTSWKLESDDDRIEYQFDYDDAGTESEVTVDVETKKVTVDG